MMLSAHENAHTCGASALLDTGLLNSDCPLSVRQGNDFVSLRPRLVGGVQIGRRPAPVPPFIAEPRRDTVRDFGIFQGREIRYVVPASRTKNRHPLSAHVADRSITTATLGWQQRQVPPMQGGTSSNNRSARPTGGTCSGGSTNHWVAGVALVVVPSLRAHIRALTGSPPPSDLGNKCHPGVTR